MIARYHHLLVITLLPAIYCLSLVLGTHDGSNNNEPPTNDGPQRESKLANLPPMFNFASYKQQFNKHYTSLVDELRHKALFFASCLRVLPIRAAYLVGLSSYSAGLNWDSDLSPEERRLRRSGVARPKARPRKAFSLDRPANDEEAELEAKIRASQSSRYTSPKQPDEPEMRLLDSEYLNEKINSLLERYKYQPDDSETDDDDDDDDIEDSAMLEALRHELEMDVSIREPKSKTARVCHDQVDNLDAEQEDQGICGDSLDGGGDVRLVYNWLDDLLDSERDYELDLNRLDGFRSTVSVAFQRHPTGIDWSRDECMPMASDQGLCSSCYITSTLIMLEFYLCRKNALPKGKQLSREFFIDCGPRFTSSSSGCDGGEPNITLDMASEIGALWLDEDYAHYWSSLGGENGDGRGEFVPQTKRRGSQKEWTRDRCPFEMDPRSGESLATQMERAVNAHGDAGYTFIRSAFTYKNMEMNKADCIRRLQYGPISINMHFPDAALDYNGGIFTGANCKEIASSTDYLHVLLLVGYGRMEDGRVYFIARNSFGHKWGLNGNMNLAIEVPDECFSDAFYLVDDTPPSTPPPMARPTDGHDSGIDSDEDEDDQDQPIKPLPRSSLEIILSGLHMYDIKLAQRIEAQPL